MGKLLNTSESELRDRFFALETPRDVAKLLEVEYSALIYYTFRLPFSKQYQYFEIRKKSGGVRKILAPATPLKLIQSKLNQVLLRVYKPKTQVHSFVYDKSILSNAKSHVRKNVILNLDLLDFFPSIHFGRVWGMFLAPPYSRNRKVATVLARICSLPHQLPQGSPSSPIVSNMICGKLDSELLRFADANDSYFTRYADDITISTYRPSLPDTIVSINQDGSVMLSDQLNNIIRKNGFFVNSNKVRLLPKSKRQEVNNITVNRFPNVQRKYWKQVRSMLHVWEKYGYERSQQKYWEAYNQKYRSPWTQKPKFSKVLKGKIEYLGMIRGKNDPKYLLFMKKYADLYKRQHPEYYFDENSPGQLKIGFEELRVMEDYQRRGYLFEGFLRRLFTASGIEMKQPFRRNSSAEQIDGSFDLNGWFYLVEAKWTKDLADIRQIDGLYGQVERSGQQTMGVFIHINGWSERVIPALKQNPRKVIVLINGDDIYNSLKNGINFKSFLLAKLNHLNTRSEPHLDFLAFSNL